MDNLIIYLCFVVIIFSVMLVGLEVWTNSTRKDLPKLDPSAYLRTLVANIDKCAYTGKDHLGKPITLLEISQRTYALTRNLPHAEVMLEWLMRDAEALKLTHPFGFAVLEGSLTRAVAVQMGAYE